VIALALFLTLPQDCRTCHAIEDSDHSDSIHARKSIDCASCHGTDEFDTGALDPHKRTPKFLGKPKDVVAACAACHPGVADQFRESRHFPALNKKCLACHEPHATREADWKEISRQCAACHKPGEAHHGAAEALGGGISTARGRSHKLEEAVRSAREIPGSSLRTARAVHEEMEALVHELAERQHAMKLGVIEEDLRRVSGLEAEGRAALQEISAAPSRRMSWLVVFLLLLISAGTLAAFRMYHRAG
jgi:hypothetical protein